MHITSEWAMVFITTIYVVATIFILCTSKKEVEVMREQLAEMKKEFDELHRPIVEVELDLSQRVMYNLCFYNRGRRAANNVKIKFDEAFLSSINNATFIEQIRKQEGKECIIGPGQHYELYLFDIKEKDTIGLNPVSGKVEWQSNGLIYSSHFSIDVKNYMTFFSSESDDEKLRKLIDRQNAELSRINETIGGLATVVENLQKKR